MGAAVSRGMGTQPSARACEVREAGGNFDMAEWRGVCARTCSLAEFLHDVVAPRHVPVDFIRGRHRLSTLDWPPRASVSLPLLFDEFYSDVSFLIELRSFHVSSLHVCDVHDARGAAVALQFRRASAKLIPVCMQRGTV